MIGSTSMQSNLFGLATQTSRANRGNETGKSSGTSQLDDLFSKLDSDSSGDVSSSELQTLADKLWSDTLSALLALQESDTSSTTTSTTTSTTSSDGAASDDTSTDTTSTTTGDTLLAAMDSDGDGSVSESELSDYLGVSDQPPPPPPMGEQRGSKVASAEDTSTTTPSTADASTVASSIVSAADTDGDGAVSTSELTDWLETASASSSSDSGATDDTSTADTSSSDTSTSSFSAMMAQMVMQSYGRAQDMQSASLVSSLTSALDTAA